MSSLIAPHGIPKFLRGEESDCSFILSKMGPRWLGASLVRMGSCGAHPRVGLEALKWVQPILIYMDLMWYMITFAI